MRDRLLRDFGTAANQVLWRGQAPLIGDSTFADAAVYAEDGWLAKCTRRPPQHPAAAEDHRRTSRPA